jgi:hypothetical protein
VSLFPGFQATGKDLVLRYKHRTDVPPLIEIRKFSIQARLSSFMQVPWHVERVHLDGLKIHVPPRNDESEEPHQKSKGGQPNIVVDVLTSKNALLEILPKEAGKVPLEFEIYSLTMHDVGKGRPAAYQALLTNPTPRGLIETSGSFGPWQTENPRQTPLSGDYYFKNADLATFSGISGILSSRGNFKGILEHIEAEGDTDTPDFSVGVSGHRMALHTHFNAIIDGTNGDTYLQPVRAQFLKTSVLASGKVIRIPGVKGSDISLDIAVDNGRVEDLFKLAVKGKTAMTGAVSFHSKFDLPPGNGDIAERLRLDGVFGIGSARFTKLDVQKRIDALSVRAQGHPEEVEDPESVVSAMKGRFKLRNETVSFSRLSFAVPGALVLLDGSYGLRTEDLDFHGKVQLQAKLSQTTTGFKSFLLKLADPFFKKEGGGSQLPIRITGKRDNPSFGLDLGR